MTELNFKEAKISVSFISYEVGKSTRMYKFISDGKNLKLLHSDGKEEEFNLDNTDEKHSKEEKNIFGEIVDVSERELKIRTSLIFIERSINSVCCHVFKKLLISIICKLIINPDSGINYKIDEKNWSFLSPKGLFHLPENPETLDKTNFNEMI